MSRTEQVTVNITVPIPASLRRDLANVRRAAERLLEVQAQRRKLKATGKLETKLAVALRKAFKAQERALLKRLAERYTFAESARTLLRYGGGVVVSSATKRELQEAAEPDWGAIFDDAGIESLATFQGPLEDYLKMAISAGATEVLAALGVDASFDLANEQALKYAKQRAAEAIKEINEATRKKVNDLIGDAIENGTPYNQLAAQLKDVYAGFHTPASQQHIPDRATLIAITEVGQAYEAGTEAAVKELEDGGLVMEKSWLTAGDDRVSDGCQENADAGWIDFGDAFPSGDQRPLRFPGCRCTCLYRRKGAG